MKTFSKLFIPLVFALGVRANAQITLLKTYPVSGTNDENFQPVYLKHSGFKFAYLHSDSITIYNMNLSLFENIIIPGPWDFTQIQVRYISEGLFDTDSLHIDYLLQGTAGNYYDDSLSVYTDNGTRIFRDDSADFFGGYWPSMGGSNFYQIMTTDSGTFMSVTSFRKPIESTQLYKLPGSLPCVPGCYGDYYSSIAPINNNGNTSMNIYPNPAVTYTNIYYTLPPGTTKGEINLYDLAGRVLKKYTVTSQFDHLRLTTSDIAAGTYFYQLMVNGTGIATKKIIVVK